MSDGGPPPQQMAAPGWYRTPDGTTAWWDGYQWQLQPPRAPSASRPYRPVAVASALVQAAFAAVAAASLLLVWAHLRRRQAAVVFGDRLDLVTATRLDDASGVVGLLSLGYLVAFVAAVVAVPVLCNRLHHNLDGPLSTRGLEYTPGWAAGWWFVPFANFVMPYRVVVEAWRASEPTYPHGSLVWRSVKVPALVTIWWGAFIVAGLVGRIHLSTIGADGRLDPRRVELASTVGAFGSAITLFAAALALVVFRQLSQRHIARARLLGLADG